jgi:hypothetical protein
MVRVGGELRLDEEKKCEATKEALGERSKGKHSVLNS